MVEGAHREAIAADAGQIAVEHLLVSVADDSDGVGGRALASLGHDATALRAGLEAWEAAALQAVGIRTDAMGRAGCREPAGRPARRLGFAPGSKRALEEALRAAVRHGDRRIDGGHILSGLLRDRTPSTAAILGRLGLDPDAVERAVHSARHADARRSA